MQSFLHEEESVGKELLKKNEIWSSYLDFINLDSMMYKDGVTDWSVSKNRRKL